ncbi:MAG: hypothetical protein REI11_11550, partial [Patulibacter sp.]|nr:hypothetical protein [Patulibacter sp.]
EPGDPQRATLQQVAEDAGRAHDEAEAHVAKLKTAVASGEAARGWDTGDMSGPQAQRAAGWLDTQAQTPPADRSYRQLAGIRGVSPSQWDALDESGRAELHASIDSALAARSPAAVGGRPSALEALGHVASQQAWWDR